MIAKFLLAVMLLTAVPLTAGSLDTWSAGKPHRAATLPVASPAGARSGGETFATAVEIPSLPYTDSGTTAGAIDDYDEICPYDLSESPDVVYSYYADNSGSIAVDLCRSSYDTKVFVYDEGLNPVACNDDFYSEIDPVCGAYSSKIEYLELQGGTMYYIVIDGYSDDFGDYEVTVTETPPFDLNCGSGDRVEGEPPLQNGQDLAYNSGCSGGEGLFQTVTGGPDGELTMCLRTGWISDSPLYVDTDWLEMTVGPGGLLHLSYDADWTTNVYAFTGGACMFIPLLMPSDGGRGDAGVIDLELAQGTVVWLELFPASSSPPNGETPYEYDVELHVTGLEPAPAVNERMNWGSLKTLYR